MNFEPLDLNCLYWPCGRGTSIGSHVVVICCVLQGRLLLCAADGRLLANPWQVLECGGAELTTVV